MKIGNIFTKVILPQINLCVDLGNEELKINNNNMLELIEKALKDENNLSNKHHLNLNNNFVCVKISGMN